MKGILKYTCLAVGIAFLLSSCSEKKTQKEELSVEFDAPTSVEKEEDVIPEKKKENSGEAAAPSQGFKEAAEKQVSGENENEVKAADAITRESPQSRNAARLEAMNDFKRTKNSK